MKSCIYEGHIRHSRVTPVQNDFKYTLFMMYLDLAELDEVFKEQWLWSVARVNLAYLRRADHFGDSSISIDQAVRDLIYAKSGQKPKGPVRMLTHLRYFGHCFNPATFYYCYDQADTTIETIVVEIHNTPWGEVHCYVLEKHMEKEEAHGKKYSLEKNFHVSPFIDMDISYSWFFSDPSETLNVCMIDFKAEQKVFAAELDLQRREISGASLSSVLLRYPFMTLKVGWLIYWQALRLWQKGAPFYTHPKRKNREETS
ncbi:MAG: DUF1365 domain-containing protein [Proteobacteria bacterium]|nr:DUF1365 domain-containing protein [Pseudomonadota bacterium]